MKPIGTCPCGLIVLHRRAACSCGLVTHAPERTRLAPQYAFAALALIALWLLMEVV